jgi:hypothetical protein
MAYADEGTEYKALDQTQIARCKQKSAPKQNKKSAKLFADLEKFQNSFCQDFSICALIG